MWRHERWTLVGQWIQRLVSKWYFICYIINTINEIIVAMETKEDAE